MQKKFAIFLALLVLMIVGGIISTKRFFPKKEIHYHAGFQVYLDGKLQDFSDLKYMFIKPCVDEKSEQEEDEELEKAHLHDQVGDVVHVEAEGAKWKDLFRNINFKIDNTKQFKSYVNGRVVNDILDYPIKPFDSVVIFIGNMGNKEEKLKHQVSKKRIEEIGKKSETCGEDK